MMEEFSPCVKDATDDGKKYNLSFASDSATSSILEQWRFATNDPYGGPMRTGHVYRKTPLYIVFAIELSKDANTWPLGYTVL